MSRAASWLDIGVRRANATVRLWVVEHVPVQDRRAATVAELEDLFAD